MSNFFRIFGLLLALLFLPSTLVEGSASSSDVNQESELNVKEFILHHVADAYEWHITRIGTKQITIPLPVIVYSKYTGWHVFLSSRFHENVVYQGFAISKSEKFTGKIVEIEQSGTERRPFDISLTKNALSLIISSSLLILVFMSVAKSYKKQGFYPKGKFVAFTEMFVMNIYEEVIKPCVGKDYKRYAPYLLTLFFFIFINNILGLIPVFPGGANVTGNITITFVLAFITFLIVNITGTKEYWKEILWPDVPVWLKAPIPFMPVIELAGIFMKPFALMIRLFANMLAGHSITLALVSVIFVTAKMGAATHTGMTALSVFFSVFLGFVELLVAYIQAYVFTMLTAVFIGLGRVESHKKAKV
ncbi:MAG: F0F1 ATP synthase subunit A [Paludibacter sp.]|nr:F0F1 ATP synthase subunit A [Paludibacter sp.]